MILETDKYLVTTDDREQFVLQMKREVKDWSANAFWR